MHKDTFKHFHMYRITRYGKINPTFPVSGNKPVILGGEGESVWFVGLVWKKRHPNQDERTRFFLIASNYYRGTNTIYVEHDEESSKKIYRVKLIEPYTLKELPLLIGTKTTTLYDKLLKNDKPKILQSLINSRNVNFLSDM